MSDDKTITSGADRGTMEPIDKQNSSKIKLTIFSLLFLTLITIVYFALNSNKKSTATVSDTATSDRINNPEFLNLDIPEKELTIDEPEPPPPPEPVAPESPEVEEIVTVAEIRAAEVPSKPDPILERRMNAGFSTINIVNNNQNQDTTDTTNNIVSEEKNQRVIDYDTQGVAKVTASKIKNRSLIITQGAKLPCTLETALDSTVPGMTSCIVGHDIYSSDGKIRLIDRGSKLNGRYQGDMKRGQARIAVLWERLETPEGVIINLSSPSTDPLGRAGAGGYVDSHFWERFGNAIMLSLISDAFQYLDDSRSNRENRFEDTQQSTQEMAQIALENEINISPTLYKNQGEEIIVFINKDLSFENVYDISLTQPFTFEEKFHDSLYK